jgi:biotin carboxylase
MLVEELVMAKNQHCVEGWTDSKGNHSIWCVWDYNYFPGGRLAIDNYTAPSRVRPDLLQKMIDLSFTIATSHKMRDTFWNVEIWQDRDDDLIITEINPRCASVWHNIYAKAYDCNLYEAMLRVCCDETIEKTPHLFATEIVAGQFHVVTFGEGKASEYVDFGNRLDTLIS